MCLDPFLPGDLKAVSSAPPHGMGYRIEELTRLSLYLAALALLFSFMPASVSIAMLV
jgi:hypothetical protein